MVFTFNNDANNHPKQELEQQIAEDSVIQVEQVAGHECCKLMDWKGEPATTLDGAHEIVVDAQAQIKFLENGELKDLSPKDYEQLAEGPGGLPMLYVTGPSGDSVDAVGGGVWAFDDDGLIMKGPNDQLVAQNSSDTGGLRELGSEGSYRPTDLVEGEACSQIFDFKTGDPIQTEGDGKVLALQGGDSFVQLDSAGVVHSLDFDGESLIGVDGEPLRDTSGEPIQALIGGVDYL